MKDEFNSWLKECYRAIAADFCKCQRDYYSICGRVHLRQSIWRWPDRGRRSRRREQRACISNSGWSAECGGPKLRNHDRPFRAGPVSSSAGPAGPRLGCWPAIAVLPAGNIPPGPPGGRGAARLLPTFALIRPSKSLLGRNTIVELHHEGKS
jgi:hypothetical protein